MQIRSTIRRGSGVTLATAAASGISHTAALVTGKSLQRASGLLGDVTPALTTPGLEALQRLAQSPGIGVTAGVVTGLSLASGAAWGCDKVDLSEAPLWKKLLYKPMTDSFNQGIDFRLKVAEARREQEWQPALRLGAKAGWTVGATLGRTAGTIQGGITGSVLGLELSGEALSLLSDALEGTALPPLLKQSLPFLVGGVCLFTGQAVGSAVGGVVGSVVGGAVAGAGVGTFAAVSREAGPRAS